MFSLRRRESPQKSEIAHLVATADKKISAVHVHSKSKSELSVDEVRFAASCLMMHGDTAHRMSFSPNHASCGPFAVPRGFQFDVDIDAPLFVAPFPERRMFNGLMAFPLDAGVSSARSAQGGALSHAYFTQDALRKSVNRIIREDEHLGDDETNYAGIFSTTVRSGFENKLQFWAVVQCHSTALSEELFDYMCEKEARYSDVIAQRAASRRPEDWTFSTWRSFFLDDQRVAELLEAQRAHRAAVLVRLIRACGLGPVAESRSTDDNVDFLLTSPHTIHSTFNCVEQIDEDKLAFLSDMYSRRAVTTRGLIVREAPTLPLALLPGDAWSEPRDTDDTGFPCATGHREPVRYMTSSDFGKHETMAMANDSVHFWERSDDDRPFNTNLVTTSANSRDDRRWQKIERALGFSGGPIRVTSLQPVQVKLHSTEQPAKRRNQ